MNLVEATVGLLFVVLIASIIGYWNSDGYLNRKRRREIDALLRRESTRKAWERMINADRRW